MGMVDELNRYFNEYLKSFHPDAWYDEGYMGISQMTADDLKVMVDWDKDVNLDSSYITHILEHYNDNLSAKEYAYQEAMKTEAEKIRQQVGDLNDMFRKLLGNGNLPTNSTNTDEILDGYAKGTKSAKPGLHRINEKGSEAIVTRRGVMLMPLKAGDGVIPADLTANLMEMAKSGMVPVQTPSFQAPEYNVAQNNNQNVTIHYDTLIRVDGNMDSSVVPQIEEIAKGLINNNSFKKNIYSYTAKELGKDMRKAGY